MVRAGADLQKQKVSAVDAGSSKSADRPTIILALRWRFASMGPFETRQGWFSRGVASP